MEETEKFKTKPFVKRILYGFLLFLLLVLGLLLRYVLGSTADQTRFEQIVAFFLAGVLPLSLLARVLISWLPKAMAEYELLNGHLVIHRLRKPLIIPFDQISEIRLSLFSPRFFGGFSIHLKTGQVYKVSSLVERSHHLLRTISEAAPDLISVEKLIKYENLSLSVGISWQRILFKLTRWKGLLFKFALLPFLSAYGLHWRGVRISQQESGNLMYLTGFMFLLNVCLAFPINSIEEKINLFMQRPKEGVLPFRNLKVENRLHWISQGLFYFLWFGLALWAYYGQWI